MSNELHSPDFVRRLDASDPSFDSQLGELIDWDVRENPDIREATTAIIEDVEARGDQALIELTNKFDGRNVTDMEDLTVTSTAMRASWEAIPESERKSLQSAAERIREFHERQLGGNFEWLDEYGNQIGQRVVPVDRIGVYVPGGSAVYPSTVLMTVIPAHVAGVHEIVVTVPAPQDQLNDHVLAALKLVGVSEVYSIGGAQAIAALAHGTQTIKQVDKIVGPGGAWVAAAKKQVFGPVGIDSIAGPSEILIIADEAANPEWVAWDLLSQAEHDEIAQAILISPSQQYLDTVESHINGILVNLPRKDIAIASLRQRGGFVLVTDLIQAVDIANTVAPEHLQLAVEDPDDLLPLVKHAGAIFLGGLSGEVMGDYVAGPSHVLPTFGTARYASPLGVYDFTKRSSVIRLSEAGAENLGRVAADLATLEGLDAHASAARMRLSGFDSNQPSRSDQTSTPKK